MPTIHYIHTYFPYEHLEVLTDRLAAQQNERKT